ncbi:MAG: hypothetical protein ACTHMZ_08705 [Actinomycetes bacterium]
MRLSHLPLRLATGAYILTSGMSKRGVDGEAAAGMQGMAANALPQLPQIKQLPPEKFASYLSKGEMALGAALIVPFAPSVIAGAGLAAFGAGLVQLYLRTPGMRKPGSVAPTPEGIGLAKDVWLAGAGLTLVFDSLRRHGG